MKAAVLCIGTELVDGQIFNKNASWISAELKKVGLQTTTHLVVPDDRKLILQALKYCEEQGDLIFVTGGLGPTSDDFTRDVITEWLHEPLEFDADSWRHLSDRLTSLGYQVQEIQRQQCYFPRHAKILFNPEGTANAFQVHYKKKDVFVLPGPPREIAAVWKLSIDWWLKEKTAALDSHVTRMWDTMGKGESDIAVIVEEVLAGSGLEIGYRVHLPYVEVKVSYLDSETERFAPAVEKLNQALQFCTVTRDGEDVAESFASLLGGISSLHLIDEVSGPFLANRMLPVLRPFMSPENTIALDGHSVRVGAARLPKQWTFSNAGKSFAIDSERPTDLLLQLSPIDEHNCEVGFDYHGRRFVNTIVAPYRSVRMQERRKQYFAECALIFWRNQLRDL